MLIQYPAVATNRYNYDLPGDGKGRYKASVQAGLVHLDFHIVDKAGRRPQAGTQIVFNFGVLAQSRGVHCVPI